MLVPRFFTINKLFLTALIIISFVPTYIPASMAQEASSGQAEIVIEARSNSIANRGKNYNVTYYQDEQCSKRGKSDKVFKKRFAKDVHIFNSLRVDTDVNFIFQVAYTEKRRNETRSCTYIVNVALQPGHSYKAVYEVIDQVNGCGIKVFDVTQMKTETTPSTKTPQPIEIPVSKPALSCEKVGKTGFKNGLPVYSYKDRLG